MTRTISIASRFNGPPGSGNGGYVCGLLAKEIDGPSQAILRVPPPLEKPLTLEADSYLATLHDGDVLVGEAKPVAFDLVAPPAPTLAEARDAAKRYAGFADHRYPTCFVCGQSRPAHDGLDLFTGKVEGRDMVACTWTPGADLADANGIVRPEFIHAALDCPSYWALTHAGKPALLASLTASIDAALPRTGEELIVAAWPIREDGRKHWGAAVLYTAQGAVIARAEALWIEPKQA
ncbi:hotdog family protein [Terricaulis silvestris]|uniref:Uncharacterized protein n=1 Tax=Terricaulis silvestris TaxID=2686094 RepID=A0A6I6MJP4_9CAUL|nr:hypothetical protein [Terricaulis silvestris]QGZ93276.1 hypothetical protein DSM104635_00085 [Terricaulis silvestris]